MSDADQKALNALARDAGAIVVNEQGEEVETDFTEPGTATAYLALLSGEVADDIEEELPEIAVTNDGKLRSSFHEF